MWPKFNLKRLIIIVAVLAMSVFIVSNIAAQDATASTDTPTQEATAVPTEQPTAVPTEVPTAIPTIPPTAVPTEVTLPDTSSANKSDSSPAQATEEPTAVPTVEPTVVPTTVPAVKLTVSKSEPSKITAGQSGNLSILGTNFTKSTIVRLVGYGFLTTSLVNDTALTAALPNGIAAGVYTVEVSDTTNGTANSPTTLTVSAAAVVTTAVPTSTPIPGQPKLVVSNFSANPSTIYAGDTTQLTLSVVNVGSRTAEGVVVSLGDTKFTPANGQSSITLPDIPASGAYTLTLAATAPSDATEGPQSIAIVMTSRDFSGDTYTDNGTLSVMVATKNKGESQVVLDSYLVTPNVAAPGDTVTVKALFKNTGTQTASQVLVQLDSSSGLLLSGANGSAFSLGDMTPGSTVPLVMSLVVASDAKSGAQAQAFDISYLQDDTAKQSTASISLDVEEVVEATPLILLQAYSVGDNQVLQPDQQFTFSMTVQNAGTVDVSSLLVTFGTVQNSSTSSSTSSSSTASSTQTASTTTTTNSDSFSIYGSGGTLLIGELAAGKQATVTQGFIVNTDLTSGIHDLPITLQFQLADGTTKLQSLDATLFVVVPPSVRITSTKTLDDPLTAKTETTISLKVANIGDSQVNLTDMKVTGDNATVTAGDITLDPLAASDDVTKTVTFSPEAAGDYTLTVAVNYVDDMNRTQTITQTYSGTVKAAAAQTTNAAQTIQRTAPQSSQNELGRLLLGFLGFGG